MNIALLYFFAIGGLSVVGLLMAGWASFNKYSLLGGIRSAAQVISYEIPLTLSVVGLLILAGTMSLNQLVENHATTGGALSIANLDALLDAVDNPTHLVMNKTMARRLNAAPVAPTRQIATAASSRLTGVESVSTVSREANRRSTGVTKGAITPAARLNRNQRM